MSFNQSKSDKSSESSRYRKSGRSGNSGNQRNFSGTPAGGKGGGGNAPPPQQAPSLNSSTGNRSFKKSSNNGQGSGQSRVTVPNSNSELNFSAAAAPRQNGAHIQPPMPGVSDAPASIKPTNPPSAPRSTRPVPKAPSSQSTSGASDTVAPSTPAKADAPKSFQLQFGTISPGVMNGMQIPARTSSAPPNLDEQKRDQARHDSFRAAPTMPIPSAPKQQQPVKDVGSNKQSSTLEPHTVLSQARRDVQPQAPSIPGAPVAHKPSVLSVPGMPMQMPFQSHIPGSFGSPSSQIQSQGITIASLQMPMPLSVGGTAQVLPNIQSHPMHTQGMIPQGQNMNFATQLGHQMPPQMIGISPQFPQPQAAKFGSARKTVKITHPDTHEELRLDKRTDSYTESGSSGPRGHPNLPPQSQPMPYPPHQMNYYPPMQPSSFSPSMFFPSNQTALPLTSSQMTSGPQAARFTFPVGQVPPPSISIKNPITLSKNGPPVHTATESIKVEHPIDAQAVTVPVPQAPVKVTSKPSIVPLGEKAAVPLPDASINSNASEPVNDGIRHRVGDNASLSSTRADPKSEGTISENLDVPRHIKQEPAEVQQDGIRVLEGENEVSQGTEQGGKKSEMLMESTHSESSDGIKQTENDVHENKAPAINGPDSVISEPKHEVSADHCSSKVEITADNLTKIATVSSDEIALCVESTTLHDDRTANNITSTDVADKDTAEDVSVDSSSTSPQESSPESNTDVTMNHEAKSSEISSGGVVSSSILGPKDKPTLDTNKAKNTTAKGKKKRKDILKAADAAGSTSDLYMAYKGPEEKQENAVPSENIDSSSGAGMSNGEKDVKTAEEDGQSKAEPDDWEDAAEMSTPKLKTPPGVGKPNEDGKTSKKYSRDFLLTLSEQCTDLPAGFEIGSDIADALMSVQVGIAHLIDREMYQSGGRNVDRQSGGPRVDRRGSGIVDEDKWNKSFGPGNAHGGPAAGFRPSPGGVLRNPRGPAPGQYVGGILSGPMQQQGGGMQRTHSDADRWQRATGYQKGLIPSPQTPLQIMHKAEKKYEIRKVSDIEEAKQRQLKAILNKLTPQNFEKLFEQVKEVNIDNAVTLTGVISQIFDKALMEPTFCEMYANFCSHLAAELPDFSEDNEKITFKRLLLNKCQEEFERGEREQAEADRVEEEGEVKCSDEEREEKRVQARRRMLGNIRLIGELYKKKMLTERIMHECIKKLLGQSQNPDEEDIESLCKLMSTIGEMIDHPKAKTHMDAYFEIMTQFSNNMKLSSRVRFMLKDSIDLRKNKWQQRRKVEGPKKIDEVHRDAAQERHAQATRLSRGPSMNNSSSSRGRQTMEFAPRGSPMLTSPNSQIGGSFRGFQPQQQPVRYGQDVRMEERHSYESRTVPLSQRPIDDNSITLGPQGGLARGMSVRGHGPPLVEMPPRFSPGPNGYSSNSSPDWSLPSREEQPRYTPQVQASPSPVLQPEKVISEDRLRDMSMSTIREFYSAKDKEEVALCIKDLNTPSFYPSMVSIWVTDSFERKDMERDLLAKLLVDLTKPHDSLLSELHLIKGFESVFTTLEDAVNDAPRAAEFLGRILARSILENVVPLKEIGRLIREGGEEAGSLLESGLGSEVLGSILESMRLEKGEGFVNEIRSSSSLKLEDFRPPDPRYSSKKLEAFF